VAILVVLALSGIVPSLASIPATMSTPGALVVVSTNLPLIVTPTPGGNTAAMVSVKLSDGAGVAQLLNPSGGTIQIATTSGTNMAAVGVKGDPNCTITQIDANTAYVNATFSVPSTWPAGTYNVNIYFMDGAGNHLTVGDNWLTLGTLTVQPLVGLTVTTTSINFGTVQYSAANGPQNVSWSNTGNTPINIAASGADWHGSGTTPGSIPISSLTANAIPLSNSGTQVVTSAAIGGGAQTMPMIENMVPYSSGIAGQSFSTAVTLTATAAS
jgi:hypothetical protein